MYSIVKRLMDVAIAFLSLALLSPLFLIIIVILILTGEGDIVYLQERVGLDNKPFKLFKFVTMRKGSLKSGSITYKNDPRILPFGKILRDTKLNELLQLFNVLIGDMSVVGPRPLFREGFDLYPEKIKVQVYAGNKPGLTGLGSLYFRDEEELLARLDKDIKTAYREDIMPVKGALELWYKNNKSISLDLRIIFLTGVSVLWPRYKKHMGLFRSILPDAIL